MGGTCGRHGREDKMHRDFLWESLNERHHLEDLGVDEKVIMNIRSNKIWQLISLSIRNVIHSDCSQQTTG
jgi:hypothetical protein